MATPKAGDQFPSLSSGRAFNLDNFPLVLIVWRTGCSTSRLAIPYFDRMHRNYPGANVLGVCQDSDQELKHYAENNDLQLPQISDEGLLITRELGIRVVPSWWLVGASGQILLSGEGWDREKIEGISNEIALIVGEAPKLLVTAGDNVPAFKPG